MPFYADILPMGKGNFRGGEYSKAIPAITENFQFGFDLKDKNGYLPHKTAKYCSSRRNTFSEI